MGSTFHNSVTTTGNRAPRLETGIVSSVNPQNMTLDWVAQHTGKQQAGVQIMTPYIHYNNGEGFTCLPEPGAVCVLCWPSDEESPFVMGFITPPESAPANAGSTDKSASPPVVKTASSTGAATPALSDASYRCNRPVLNPGDMLWQGRDENFIALRRGGVLQIGSTNICQRVYIPVGNYIRDFCENWEVNTAAGSMSWVVHPSESTPESNAPTEFSLIVREYAQDKMASIKVSVGSLFNEPKLPSGVDSFLEIIIAPDNIDPKDGTVSSPLYTLRIGKDGSTETIQADRKVTINGKDNLDVEGDQTIYVKGDRALTVDGAITEAVKGAYSITGEKGSAEIWHEVKSIDAAAVKLGSASASEPAVLGLQLLNWLATHTHVPNGPPTSSPTLSSILAKKTYVA